VSAAMLLTLLFVVFVYLFAVESFTAFLYPDPERVAAYFKAAELPSRLFDMMIGAATLMTIIGWCYVYITAHGRSLPMPSWIEGIRIRLYVLFLNRLYVDECVSFLSRAQMAAIRRFDEPAQGRLP
jgi:NADH-quinone oxidoreductase subunit L